MVSEITRKFTVNCQCERCGKMTSYEYNSKSHLDLTSISIDCVDCGILTIIIGIGYE